MPDGKGSFFSSLPSGKGEDPDDGLGAFGVSESTEQSSNILDFINPLENGLRRLLHLQEIEQKKRKEAAVGK